MALIEAESRFDLDQGDIRTGTAKPRRLTIETPEDLARTYARQVELPELTTPLCELIHGLQAIEYLSGTALVSREARHISVYILADLHRSDVEAQQALGTVRTTYNQFAGDLHKLSPTVRSRIGFYHTPFGKARAMTTTLKHKWIEDPTVSLISFLIFK